MTEHHDMHYRVSGVDLEAAGYEVLAESQWAASVSLSGSRVELPGRPGYTPVGLPKVSAPPLALTIRHHATSQADVEAHRNELVGMLADPYAVIRRSSGGHTTEAPFLLESLEPREFLAGSFATYTAVLSISGGMFRSLTATDHDAPVGTTTLPIRGTGPVHDAVVRFAGPISGTVTVTDARTGTGITWSGTAYQGQYVFVNLSTMRAHVGAAGAWGSGADVTAGVDYPPAGPLLMWSKPGAPLGSVVVPAGDRTLAGAQLVQDPDTLIWRLAEPSATPLPSNRTVTVKVTGAPATIRVKEAWL